MTHETPTVDVSIVVIGRNEGERLVNCLKSVQGAHFGNLSHELIYVDSASTDGSPERAVQWGAKVVHVKPERPCAAIGRNAGWKASRGRTVLFLDGDTQLHPDFIHAATQELLKNADHAVVWGHRREIHPDHTVFNRVLDLDWIYAPGDTDFCGGDALFRRSALVQTNGFNEHLIAGEEPELCARLRQQGGIIRHIDHPMTTHDLAMTNWRQYWLRAERAGHAYAEVSHQLLSSATPLWVRESARNLWHGSIILLALLAVLVTVLAGFWLSAISLLCLGGAIAFRSAWKARWKKADAVTLLLYGVHCHLQQVPILWGQVRWFSSQKSGARRKLIDYKD
jgi:glycosyltransferase involved in cell wall biosynthesis